MIEFVYYQFKDFMNDSSQPSKTRDVTSEYWLSWNSLPLTALNFWRNDKIRWPRVALFNSQAELKEITCPIFCLKYSFQYCSKIVSKQFNVDWPNQCIKDLSKINKKVFFPFVYFRTLPFKLMFSPIKLLSPMKTIWTSEISFGRNVLM